jgi:hypothetical protein
MSEDMRVPLVGNHFCTTWNRMLGMIGRYCQEGFLHPSGIMPRFESTGETEKRIENVA